MYRCVLIGSFCLAAAFAQSPAGDGPSAMSLQLRNPGELGAVSISVPFAPLASDSVAGAPYSAEAVTQRTQLLADGNRIEQSTSDRIARDAAGRTRIERNLPALELAGAKSPAPALVTITDPVAGYEYLLNPVEKTAVKMPLYQKNSPPALKAKLDAERAALGKLGMTAPGTGPAGTKTDLGTQTVQGVTARGSEIKRSIPAGAVGNQLPIEITSTTWYSPDLKVMVMSKSSDPRIGETTYMLTNLVRGEPDPALFQVPADYTFKDGAMNVFYKSSN